MHRNDIITLTVFCGMLFTLILIAFAPISDGSLTNHIWAVAESPIAFGVVSTFIAAFAGTWGAQLLAERTANRKALLAEIRGTNAALALVYSIANTYITTKKQMVRTLVQDYDVQTRAFEKHRASPEDNPFLYRLDLQNISAPFSPIDELRQILREKITIDGRALLLLIPLVQSIEGFFYTASQRNEWIAELRAMPEGEDGKKAALFFGTPYAPGRTDARYPDFIRTLKTATDDCIGFSILIAQSLESYGERLVMQYGQGAPRISKTNFDMAGDLLPDMNEYKVWTAN